MSPGRKRPISPLATQSSRPDKVPRTSYSVEERVASAKPQRPATAFQPMQREAGTSAFASGDTKATPAHPFSKVTTTAATVLCEVALDVNVSYLGIDDPSPPPAGTDVYPSNSANPGNEEMVIPASLATPEFNHLLQVPEEPNGRNVLGDDPMEPAVGHESQPSSTTHEAATAGDIRDEELSELSYASDHTQYPTDRSTASPSPSPVTIQSTPNGRRSPYVAISSREHSFYQARGRRLEGSFVGFPEIPDPPVGQSILAIDEVPDAEPIGPAIATSTPQKIDEVYSASLASERPRDPAALVKTASGSSAGTDIRGNTTLPSGSVHALDSSEPSIPHRVRFRGFFFVGSGAAIKIDDTIEVCLRDGVNGQVDFVI